MRIHKIPLTCDSRSWLAIVENFCTQQRSSSLESLESRQQPSNRHHGVVVTPFAGGYGKEFLDAWKARPGNNAEIVVYGRKVKTARKVCLYGGRGYSFSGNSLAPRNDCDAPALFARARKALDTFLGNPDHLSQMDVRTTFNIDTLLVNWYDSNTRDHIGMHSDNTSALVQHSPILCVSFGVERRFVLQDKQTKEKTVVWPRNGDLVIMGGRCQQTHTHGIPPPLKSEPAHGKRISVTARLVLQK